MLRDLIWAVRWLRKNPLFALAVTAILALGIGANTAVFSIVDAVLLRPLPFDSPARLVRVEETSAKRPSIGITAKDFFLMRGRTDLFEKTAAHVRDYVTMTGAGEPEQIAAQRVSAGLFSMLGARARLGRPLVETDDDFGAPNAAVLSDRLWRRVFHADQAVIGRSIALGDDPYTIVGVMPPEFDFPSSDIEMWVPLRLTPTFVFNLQVVARTRVGIGLPAIQGAMEITARHLEQEDPQKRAGLKIVVSPFRDTVERQYELTLIFVLAAVGLVLLIACADVGSLLISRAVERQKEIAIRASLGAGFWRVARQLLAESLVLAAIGSAAGVAVAHYAIRFLTRQLTALPIVLPHLQRVSLNQRVLLFNAALCLLLACLFSVAPVFLAAKTDLQGVLRGGLAAGGPKGPTRVFSFLIAAETAFAFLLLVGSGLMIRSLIRLQQADHGFHPDHVMTMRVPVGSFRQMRPGKYDTKPRQMAYYHDLVEHLERVPGVKAVAVVNNLPLTGANTVVDIEGPNGDTFVAARTISPQYFQAMGIPLVTGRFFSEADQTGSAPVIIVNERFAREQFPAGNALGQTLRGTRSTPPTIVGIVKDSSQLSYEAAPVAEVYYPYQQFIFGVFLSTVVVRTSGEPLSVAAGLRNAVWAVDRNQPVVKIQTMDEVIANSIWRPRFSAWIFTVLGSLALILTSTGVYGVVAYTTKLRAREVGIRMALGATPADVAAVVVRGAMMPLALGLAISFAAALMLARLLGSVLYKIGSFDLVTYAGAAAVLLAVGVVASARPAWKAVAGDPLAALRNE